MVKGATIFSTTGQADVFLFFCVLAGSMVFHLFWCDTVRSGCRIGNWSDLRIVCSRFDAIQVKKTFFALYLSH